MTINPRTMTLALRLRAYIWLEIMELFLRRLADRLRQVRLSRR